jgi:sigma-B regulation protein RsbQ
MERNEVMRRHAVTRREGGEQVLLLAHGFGCDQTIWNRLLPELDDTRTVVTFDYVGSGRSVLTEYSTDRYQQLDGYADDVIDIIEALDAGPVTFVGHSVSAMIGALASIRRPDLFRALVMLGPSPRYINDPPGYTGGFELPEIEGLLDIMERNPADWPGFLAPMVMGNDERPDLTTELEQRFCAVDRQVAADFARTTFLSDNRDDLPQVSVPTLVVQCARDRIAPRGVGDFVVGQLHAAEFSVLDVTGHCPHVSHPREVADAMRRYLDSLG